MSDDEVPDAGLSLLVERSGPVTWLTLNRPHRLNALNDDLLGRLAVALEEERRSDSSVLVLRGAGRAFSAGHDLSSDSEEVVMPGDSVADRERQASYIELFLKMWDHPKPVIAAVHGYCIAGAAQLATFADVVIVADDAKISASPMLPLGGGFISPLWAFSVGASRAKLMSFIPGRQISGKQAAEWGWAAESVPAEDLAEHVAQVAAAMARTPSSVLRMKKIAINRTLELQGLRLTALMGTETDVVVHNTAEVLAIKAAIERDGFKEVRRRFDAGETFV
ncbi:MAG: enoyl-CoA hydratase [Frankiales bacterium]|jgi:enoyl-CoA hydratase|nr:enoyl-CoA hydratase [Frankiales bacterium]